MPALCKKMRCMGFLKLEDMDLEFGFGDNVNEMEEYIRDFLEGNNMTQSRISLDIAIQMHHGQTRNEGTPYIVHPMTMACHALSLGLTEDDLIAVVLLHDVCEDCEVTVDALPVNNRIQKGVDSMTFRREKCENKDDALKRYYHRLGQNREACLTKLLDRCHNISSMSRAFSDQKIHSYVEETKRYIYPLFSHVKNTYPEFEQAVFVLEYHLKSVVEAFGRVG